MKEVVKRKLEEKKAQAFIWERGRGEQEQRDNVTKENGEKIRTQGPIPVLQDPRANYRVLGDSRKIICFK